MSSGAKERFKRAEQAAKKGNNEYAIELYLQGLALDPKAVGRRRLHEIEAIFIEEQGGNPEGNMKTKILTGKQQGIVKKLQVQKKWEEVLTTLELVIRQQPRNHSFTLQLVDALIHIEAYDSAVDVSNEIISYDKTNIEAYRRLGQVHAKNEEIEKAIEAFEKVRQLKPEDKESAKAIRDLSAANMVKQAEEKKAQAGDDSFTALLADDDKAAELEQSAKVIRTDEDRRAAIIRKKEEIKAEPTNSRLWRELAAFYADLREYKYANAAYKKAIEVNPHDMFARDKIGSLKEQIYRDKVDAMEEELEKARQNGGATDEQVAALDATKKDFLNFRVTEYARRTKEHPTDYALKIQYGELLKQSEQYDEAIQELQKAIKDPKYKVQSLNEMGLCFQAKGVLPVAIGQFNQALEAVAADSDLSKDIRYNLGVAYQLSGKTDEAMVCFQEIMAQDIGYKDVSQRVSEMLS